MNIKEVIGIDNHADSINEAHQRNSNKKGNTKCTFILGDINIDKIGDIVPTNLQQNIKLITFNFGFHYVDYDKTLEIIRDISNLLSPGSIFMGICSDGSAIKKHIRDSEEMPGIVIKPEDNEKYSFIIQSTNTNYYFTFRDVPQEYFVYKTNIIDMLELSGFFRIQIKSLESPTNPWGKYYFSWFAEKK